MSDGVVFRLKYLVQGWQVPSKIPGELGVFFWFFLGGWGDPYAEEQEAGTGPGTIQTIYPSIFFA